MNKYLGQIVESWREHFLHSEAVPETRTQRKKLWSWQSSDGVLKASLVKDKIGDMTILFSSKDISLEGAKIKITIGAEHGDLIFRRRRVSDKEVYAEMPVHLSGQPSTLANISIEPISGS